MDAAPRSSHLSRRAAGLLLLGGAAALQAEPQRATEPPPGKDPALLAGVEVETFARDLQYAEGPAWNREGYLVLSDVPANQLLKFSSTGKEVYRAPSGGAMGNAFDAQGRLYTCESRSRRVVRQRGAKVDVLAERFGGKRLNAPNDIVVRRDGHVYFTDPAFGSADLERELDFYGVYHLTPKGELTAFARPKGRPNGIALSPDGKTLYVTNSDEKNLRAYGLGDNGRPEGERVLASGLAGVPAGLVTDDAGNLYVAAAKLSIYSKEGELRTMLELTETPANLTWGDADLQTLYITARSVVYRVRMPAKGHLPY